VSPRRLPHSRSHRDRRRGGQSHIQLPAAAEHAPFCLLSLLLRCTLPPTRRTRARPRTGCIVFHDQAAPHTPLHKFSVRHGFRFPATYKRENHAKFLTISKTKSCARHRRGVARAFCSLDYTLTFGSFGSRRTTPLSAYCSVLIDVDQCRSAFLVFQRTPGGCPVNIGVHYVQTPPPRHRTCAFPSIGSTVTFASRASNIVLKGVVIRTLNHFEKKRKGRDFGQKNDEFRIIFRVHFIRLLSVFLFQVRYYEKRDGITSSLKNHSYRYT